jgi:polysaccharide deacetylase family protein (PEP-CTERM system associated)
MSIDDARLNSSRGAAETAAGPGRTNALTVDVEDYYHVEAFAHVVREHGSRWEPRVEPNTHRLLDLFQRRGVRATFFVLGRVAVQHPRLVREIARAGHEVASHGFGHELICRQTPAAFRDDVRRGKRVLEDAVGGAVEGYRAPSFSIVRESLWALDVLIDEGFRYDSSIFPVYHDRYGLPDAPRFPHLIRRPGGTIVELPPSTIAVGRVNLPIAGGGYFRLLPYWVFRWGLRRINLREGQVAVFFIHPWEVDPTQPAMPGPTLDVWRHRLNLGRTMSRLDRLLSDFRFDSARQVLSVAGLRPEPVRAT